MNKEIENLIRKIFKAEIEREIIIKKHDGLIITEGVIKEILAELTK